MKRCAERTELKTEFKLFKLYGIKKIYLLCRQNLTY